MVVKPTSKDAVEAMEEAGPAAHGDPMGTPARDEQIVWRGRPSLSVLARTAFHTRSVGIYFLILIAASAIAGNVTTALLCAGLGIAAQAVLYVIAWHCQRTTLYILTDTRLIMRIGMALETRINVPLKHVQSADLRMRSKEHGDIALSLGGERLLGYLLLWPHARPWQISRPEPMLRAVPEAEKVARLLAEACARHKPVQQNLSQIKDTQEQTSHQSAEQSGSPAKRGRFPDGKFEEAHA